MVWTCKLGKVAKMSDYFMGIDVGTGSARAGVFDATVLLVGTDKHDISLFREAAGLVEQSAGEIWKAVCAASQGAVKAAGIEAKQVSGIGFDATCSLVVVGDHGVALAVGPSEDPDRNVIVWMDHRAIDQADRINALCHPVLRYVGGKISPEMETPKLLWLKENRPDTYDAAWQFFDLADYLTWCATGSLDRSICTVTYKWTYLGHERRWDESFFKSIGLGDLAQKTFQRIGTTVVDPGTPLAEELTDQTAEDVGLVAGTAVSAGLIDAHAGGLGTIGAQGRAAKTETLGYVFGTSSCTMTTTSKPVFVPGVWGPDYSPMVPYAWLNEGGQSAAGAAIAKLLKFHPAAHAAEQAAAARSMSLPEFLGNRAPHADPNTRALIAGIGMDDDIDTLVALYIAGVCRRPVRIRQTLTAPEARHRRFTGAKQTIRKTEKENLNGRFWCSYQHVDHEVGS